MKVLIFYSSLLITLLILSSCTIPSSSVITTTSETVNINITTTTEPFNTEHTTTTESPFNLLEVHFIDVGQGDAILIDLDETKILIDGGARSSGVTTYLGEYIDGELEVMVVTHPHADHIGGLIDVLNTFHVEQFWHNGDTSTSQTYSEFMTAVQSEGADIHIAKRGNFINAGDLSFTVFNPYVLGSGTNNNSIVLSLSYGDIDFLFTGDAEYEAENDMLVQSIVPLPDIEILKVGHHGSNTASSRMFLEFISPETAIYMADMANRYGHPHQETISSLLAIGADIYGTDSCGTIIVTTDGISYGIETERICPYCSKEINELTNTK